MTPSNFILAGSAGQLKKGGRPTGPRREALFSPRRGRGFRGLSCDTVASVKVERQASRLSESRGAWPPFQEKDNGSRCIERIFKRPGFAARSAGRDQGGR